MANNKLKASRFFSLVSFGLFLNPEDGDDMFLRPGLQLPTLSRYPSLLQPLYEVEMEIV
jgi:hypothetical protein